MHTGKRITFQNEQDTPEKHKTRHHGTTAPHSLRRESLRHNWDQSNDDNLHGHLLSRPHQLKRRSNHTLRCNPPLQRRLTPKTTLWSRSRRTRRQLSSLSHLISSHLHVSNTSCTVSAFLRRSVVRGNSFNACATYTPGHNRSYKEVIHVRQNSSVLCVFVPIYSRRQSNLSAND